MDKSLEYLLHHELEGLLDPPAAGGSGPTRAAPAPAAVAPPVAAPTPAPAPVSASAPAADPASAPADAATQLAQRLRDPKVLEALVRLLEAR